MAAHLMWRGWAPAARRAATTSSKVCGFIWVGFGCPSRSFRWDWLATSQSPPCLVRTNPLAWSRGIPAITAAASWPAAIVRGRVRQTEGVRFVEREHADATGRDVDDAHAQVVWLADQPPLDLGQIGRIAGSHR